MTWDHVDFDGDPTANPPVPPHVAVWRSVRAHGDTKTKRSRRSLELPDRCVASLRAHREQQKIIRDKVGCAWTEHGLVFPSSVGTPMDRHNVLRSFRAAVKAAGLNPKEWTPRELRHSFVSLMSDAGVPIEKISQLVGHSGTAVTEKIYRHQLRPVVTGGAKIMDRLFEPKGA